MEDWAGVLADMGVVLAAVPIPDDGSEDAVEAPICHCGAPGSYAGWLPGWLCPAGHGAISDDDDGAGEAAVEAPLCAACGAPCAYVGWLPGWLCLAGCEAPGVAGDGDAGDDQRDDDSRPGDVWDSAELDRLDARQAESVHTDSGACDDMTDDDAAAEGEDHLCPECDVPLVHLGPAYECPTCGAAYVEESDDAEADDDEGQDVNYGMTVHEDQDSPT